MDSEAGYLTDNELSELNRRYEVLANYFQTLRIANQKYGRSVLFHVTGNLLQTFKSQFSLTRDTDERIQSITKLRVLIDDIDFYAKKLIDPEFLKRELRHDDV